MQYIQFLTQQRGSTSYLFQTFYTVITRSNFIDLRYDKNYCFHCECISKNQMTAEILHCKSLFGNTIINFAMSSLNTWLITGSNLNLDLPRSEYNSRDFKSESRNSTQIKNRLCYSWTLANIFMIHTVQKIQFSTKSFSSICGQIRKKLGIWSHLLEKLLIENIIFCAVITQRFNSDKI